MQFLVDKKKQEGMNDIHTYMNAVVNVRFTKIPESRGLNLFGERVVAAMVKALNQLYEGAMPVKKFIAAVNPDLLSSS